MKTVKEIIKEHLKAIGADGLCNPYEECGCGIDDLMPCMCGIGCSSCVPARKEIAPEDHDFPGEEVYVPIKDADARQVDNA